MTLENSLVRCPIVLVKVQMTLLFLYIVRTFHNYKLIYFYGFYYSNYCLVKVKNSSNVYSFTEPGKRDILTGKQRRDPPAEVEDIKLKSSTPNSLTIEWSTTESKERSSVLFYQLSYFS